MQYSVTFRHMEPSENLKEYSHDKLIRLEKYLDAAIEAEVVMTVEKFRHKAEVLIVSDGLKIKAEEETEDMYSAIDIVVDKLEKQIKRHREKLKAHKVFAFAAKRVVALGKETTAEDDEQLDSDDEFLPIDRHLIITPNLLTLKEAGVELAARISSQIIFINREDNCLSILRQEPGGRFELITINNK